VEYISLEVEKLNAPVPLITIFQVSRNQRHSTMDLLMRTLVQPFAFVPGRMDESWGTTCEHLHTIPTITENVVWKKVKLADRNAVREAKSQDSADETA
jgi:hypothetical protein